MNNMNPQQAMINYLNDLEQLRNKAIKARFELKGKYHFNIQKDYRITIFEQIDRILIYHNTNIVLFLRHISSSQYVSELFHTTEVDSIRIACDYIARNRQSLIIFLQSVLEAYYREICSVFKLNCPNSYSQILTTLFEKLEIDKKSNWYRANYILSKIRNTLHNNGIHRQKSEIVEYQGKYHDFKQNQPHNSGSYEVIISIISDVIDLLSFIGEKSSYIYLIENNGFTDISISN